MDKQELYELVNKPGQKVERSFQRYYNPKMSRHKMIKHRYDWMVNQIVGPIVLDVGCGTGLTCHLASKRDDIEEIHGVDLGAVILEQAKVNAPGVEFHQGFAEEIPFEDNYFDTAVITETLEHVADVDKALLEAHRVLKPGGRLIVTVPYKGKKKGLHLRICNEETIIEPIKKYFSVKEQFIMDASYFAIAKLCCVGVKDDRV